MNKWVEMLKNFSGKTAGEKYEVDEACAKEWIEAGLAKSVEVDPVAEVVKSFEKSLAERDEKLVKQLSISMSIYRCSGFRRSPKRRGNPGREFLGSGWRCWQSICYARCQGKGI